MNLPFGIGKPRAQPFDPGTLDMASILRERERTIERAGQYIPVITRILPVARVVSMGGRDCVVEELRLKDLAELQGYVECQVPHPLAGMPSAWADPEPDTRKARLAAALRAADLWPPGIGSDAGATILSAPAGRAFFLTLVVAKSDPTFRLADAITLLPSITPAEWSAFTRVAYGITPREEIVAELAPMLKGKPTDWCKSLDQLMEHRGLTYEQMAELTISQFHNCCNQGRAIEKSPEFSMRLKRAWVILRGIG